MRASLIDEEARQMRAHKLAVGVSSSGFFDVERSTIEVLTLLRTLLMVSLLLRE